MADFKHTFKQHSEVLEKLIKVQTEIQVYKSKQDLLSAQISDLDTQIAAVQSCVQQKKNEIEALLSKQMSIYYNIIDVYTQSNNQLLHPENFTNSYANISMQLRLIEGYIQDIHVKIHKQACIRCKNLIFSCEFCN
jgi:chromosome segregation ATPase